MSQERIESAVQRIETALARIAKAADDLPNTPPSVSALVVKHESLRDTVSNTMNDLDKLIEELGQ
ncbi:hypothetical protein QWY75_05075 [Pontixanthobacter aestiaquae]|uniref:Uncharacterized protein n=1 Tax=Pontixanthobacter aestiaquae TaxID=1509367 RepID=A0A844Z7D5_9SPHN|nr:hypothetical protein [Pontixanthobacter aestiaquae]MDN3645579.1 hypothetical protein [Pontixanthobacter aestiaquae]MXO83424.1 hypothetical protein [Pontixanthobacter aestiaquae]